MLLQSLIMHEPENTVSAFLAEAIRILPHDIQSEFLHENFGVQQDAVASIKTEKTQRYLTDGQSRNSIRPDISVEVQGNSVVAFENKFKSLFKHEQIQRYADWRAHEHEQNRPIPNVYFLSPFGFVGDMPDGYQVPEGMFFRSWSEIMVPLSNAFEQAAGRDDHVITVADRFFIDQFVGLVGQIEEQMQAALANWRGNFINRFFLGQELVDPSLSVPIDKLLYQRLLQSLKQEVGENVGPFQIHFNADYRNGSPLLGIFFEVVDLTVGIQMQGRSYRRFVEGPTAGAIWGQWNEADQKHYGIEPDAGWPRVQVSAASWLNGRPESETHFRTNYDETGLRKRKFYGRFQNANNDDVFLHRSEPLAYLFGGAIEDGADIDDTINGIIEAVHADINWASELGWQ